MPPSGCAASGGASPLWWIPALKLAVVDKDPFRFTARYCSKPSRPPPMRRIDKATNLWLRNIGRGPFLRKNAPVFSAGGRADGRAAHAGAEPHGQARAAAAHQKEPPPHPRAHTHPARHVHHRQRRRRQCDGACVRLSAIASNQEPSSFSRVCVCVCVYSSPRL